MQRGFAWLSRLDEDKTTNPLKSWTSMCILLALTIYPSHASLIITWAKRHPRVA